MKRLSMAMLLLCALLLWMGMAAAEEEIITAQATYGAAEEGVVTEDFKYDGDWADLIFVQALDDGTPQWLVAPEGTTGDDYRGKGIRYSVGEIVREGTDDGWNIIKPKTFEVFANSAEGTMTALTDTEATVEVTLTSEKREFIKETMRFAITADTNVGDGAEVGEPVDVLYNEQQEALYLIHRNG